MQLWLSELSKLYCFFEIIISDDANLFKIAGKIKPARQCIGKLIVVSFSRVF
jgi:hypothetical protein